MPPLNAVRAFEASARHGSFTLAARELGVTPAAVSQLVQKLEDVLGKKLFSRSNNRIVLTDAGTAVFGGVEPALRDIADTMRRVKQGSSRRRLVVSVVPSVAECWLVPLLPAFIARHPNIAMDLRVESDVADLAQSQADLRISYGPELSPAVVHEVLRRDCVQPLCAPSFLQRHGGKLVFDAELSDSLIHIQWGQSYASNPGWDDWLAKHAPAAAMDMTRGHMVSATRIALQFARMGLGIALANRWLAAHDIAAGTLVEAAGGPLPLGQSYMISSLPGKMQQRHVAAFRDWILAEASRQAS